VCCSYKPKRAEDWPVNPHRNTPFTQWLASSCNSVCEIFVKHILLLFPLMCWDWSTKLAWIESRKKDSFHCSEKVSCLCLECVPGTNPCAERKTQFMIQGWLYRLLFGIALLTLLGPIFFRHKGLLCGIYRALLRDMYGSLLRMTRDMISLQDTSAWFNSSTEWPLFGTMYICMYMFLFGIIRIYMYTHHGVAPVQIFFKKASHSI